MLKRFERALTDAERQRLTSDSESTAARLRRYRHFTIGLCLLTIAIGLPLALRQFRQDTGLGLLACATVVVFVGVFVWSYRSNVGDSAAFLSRLRDAAENGRAKGLRCKATRYLDVVEIEDEGREVFLEVAPERTLYLGGQRYYGIRDFPSAEMDLIEIVDSDGGIVDSQVVCRGGRLRAERTVEKDEKLAWLESPRYPQDGDVLPCGLDAVESYLRP